MSVWAQSVDVGTLAKVVGGLVAAGGLGIGLVQTEVGELRDTKASGEAIIRLEAQMAQESKHRDEQHREVMEALREIRSDVKGKADKP